MKVLRYFIILCIAVISGSLSAQSQRELGQLMRERNEYYFTLNVQDPSEIQGINMLCSVDGTNGRTVVCYANQQQYDRLLQAGYQPNLQTPPSLLEEAVMWDGNRATYEWDSYPTYSQYESMMQAFPASAASGRTCTYIELGTLSSGRKIMGVRINNGSTDGKPKFLYSSTIHGDETTGWILMLRLIDELCTSTDSRIVNLVDNLDIFIFPNTNPDGTYYGGNNTVTGARRANANNIDMNRNYPDPHSSAHPDGNAYQTETQWFMTLAETYPFVMAANYHGGAEVVNYPWDNTSTRHADDAWWQYVSREYADLCQAVSSNYMTDENNGITNGADWYTIGGGRQDYMNGYMQCREVTIECSTTKNPSASQLPTFWNYNHNSMLAYMEQCLNGVHGVVYDATTNQPIEGVTVTVLNHDDEYSIVSTHEVGKFHRPIKGGNWNFKFSKGGYHPETVNVTVADDDSENITVYLTPYGADEMECYEQTMPSAAGEYVMGYLNGSTLVMPSHNNASTVTTTSLDVTATDNGFSMGAGTTVPQVTLTAYQNGQYYISYNGRYLARSNYGSSLTWGTSTSQYGRWYINSNGIYVTRNNTNYYLYYSNGSFQLSNTQQNNIHFYVEGDCPSVVTSYTITATANPTEGGTVTGAGTFDQGATCTLTATANEGYTFVNWTENGEEVSTNAEYSFDVTSGRTLVANFELIPTPTYEITLSANPAEGGEVSGAGTFDEGTFITVTATANNGYVFVNWTENGEEVSTDAEYNFEVTADRILIAIFEVSTTIQQTVTLTPGWSWWSTYLNITLEDLENALGTNGAYIIGQEGSATYYDGFGWDGNLNTLNLSKMYKINVGTNCSIVLNGDVVNPEDYTITLNPGMNWIGFPVNHNMSLNEAFSGFTPTEGDVIKTWNGLSMYRNNGWRGTFNNLEPGKGYLYNSKASSTKTFTFPAR